MKHWITAGVVAFATWASTPGLAQSTFPDRPLRLVVSFAPGSVTDTMGRFYADKLKDQLKQPIFVENKPGASGAIGVDNVAKSRPDGYSMVLTSSAIVINPLLGKQPFDLFKDLTPIVRPAQTPYALVVNNKMPVNSLDEFIEHARKNPGKLTCANYGVGSPPHIALELLKKEAKIDILSVPFNNSTAIVGALVEGQIDCSLEPPNHVLAGNVANGRFRVIAHTGEGVMDLFPKADAFGRKYPKAVIVGWQGVFAPANTPRPVVDRLHQEWVRMLNNPEIVQKIRDVGFAPVADPLETFTQSISQEYEKLAAVIRDNNIRRD